MFLEGSYQVDITKEGIATISSTRKFDVRFQSITESIAAHQSDLYLHEQDNVVPDLDMVKAVFKYARKNWEAQLNNQEIQISQQIIFKLYSELSLNEDDQPDSSKQIERLTLNFPKDDLGTLTVHIDVRAFFRCLCRKQIWNGTLGALCLFERVPNVFYPSDTFSLNFFTARKEEFEPLVAKSR
jgi:hypothetical protein